MRAINLIMGVVAAATLFVFIVTAFSNPDRIIRATMSDLKPYDTRLDALEKRVLELESKNK